MKASEMFPSKYLKAADIEEDEIRLVIRSVTMEEFESDKGTERKPILYFQGEDKGMVLNKTNTEIIAGAYGDETKEWIGFEVLLYSAMVSFQGKMGPAIRVRIPKKKAAPTHNTITTGRRTGIAADAARGNPVYDDDDALAGLPEPRG